MAKDFYTKHLREVLHKICDNGKVKNDLSEFKSLRGYRITDDKLEVYVNVAKIIVETEYFKESSKEYLLYPFKTYKDIAKEKSVNVNSITSSISYDIHKFRKETGINLIDDVRKGIDVDKYKKSTLEVLNQYVNKSLLDKLYLKHSVLEEISDISDIDFRNLIICLKHGSKAYKSKLEGIIKKTGAYVLYLEQREKEGMLSEYEEKRLTEFRREINGI